jgi:transposase InsO family protein
VSETRHVIGVLSVSKMWVSHFAERMAPLYDLVKKNVPFKWTLEHSTAMDGVRDDLIRQIKLTKFDPNKQLVIYSDASQVGIGSFLAQQNDDGSLETIAYFSKRLSPAMQRNGATVREAYGVIMALQAAKPYVMCSQRPTIVYSDARSLSFVQQSTRSELSIRLLQQVEGLSFELRYVAGRLNSAADGLSRLGMEGARTLSAVGYTSALDDLLERLSDSPVRKADSVWVYMSEHTGAYRQVQSWRTRHGRATAMDKQAPTPAAIALPRGLCILRFDTHTCVEQARAVLLQAWPAAILMPLDLVADIQVDDTGRTIPAMQSALARARKLCYLGSNQVWLIHNVDNVSDEVCLMSCAVQCPACMPVMMAPTEDSIRVRLEDDGHEPWPDSGGSEPLHYGETRRLIERLGDRIDVTQWPELQPAIASFKPKHRKQLVHDDRSLLWRRRHGLPDQIVVPNTYRVLLMTMVHAATNHMDARTLAAELQHSYWWPTIATDCEDFRSRCDKCAISQSRKLKHHNLYAASKYTMPREEMGVDVKRLVMAGQVFNLLLMVDRFSRFATFAIVARRTSEAVITALDEHFSLFGPPKRLTVDGGKEFLSASTREWLRRQGTTIREPLPGNPQAAGHVERLWSVIKGTLRRMPDMSAWQSELRQCLFQYNTVVRKATQSSPYLLFFGGVPNTPVHRHAHAAAQYEDDDLPADAVAIQPMLAEGIEAHRSTAEAGGNLQRANTAITLNRTGIPPPAVVVGQPVWYYQDISGNSEGSKDRPRPALRTWRPGVVRAIDGVAVTLTTGDSPAGETLRRHVADLKPRAAAHASPEVGIDR